MLNIQKQVNKFIIISARVKWQLGIHDPQRATELVNRKWNLEGQDGWTTNKFTAQAIKPKKKIKEKEQEAEAAASIRSYEPSSSLWT